MTTRRQFMFTVMPAAATLAVTATAVRAADRVDEKDPAAVALGYKHDATKVDAKKYPTYKAGAACGNCQFYQGKPADAWAGCPLLAGKQVNGKGWCTGYAKKA
ncbi:MAG: high-potential iron-sulfur protein [Aquabacterium sp.]